MSKFFKRNQLIITALAALVAVVGYVNFGGDLDNGLVKTNQNASEKSTSEQKEKNKNTDKSVETAKDNTSDISDQDVLAQNNSKNDTYDIVSTDADINEAPGEAVLVNATGTSDFIVTARLEKESLRGELLENLQSIVNNTSISEAEKKSAIDKCTALTSNAEKELLAETQIRGRGFENVVVTKIEDKVDVIIMSKPINATEITRIEEIVKEKMEVEAKNITITVVDTSK